MSAALAELIARLKVAFRREKVSPEMLALYLSDLADLPPAAVELAVHELIRTSEFFPSIKAIREAAVERMLTLPGENAALAQIEERMAWARSPEAERSPEPPEIHVLVREALDRVGGWHAFRAAEKPGIVRAQFLNLYRELRSLAVREAQVGDLTRMLPAGPARKALGG